MTEPVVVSGGVVGATVVSVARERRVGEAGLASERGEESRLWRLVGVGRRLPGAGQGSRLERLN